MGLIRALIRLPLLLWMILIVGYFYFNYTTWKTETFQPLSIQLDTTKDQLANVQKQNREAETFEKERDSRFQELQSLAENFNQALEKLPKSSDTPGLLSNLAEISDRVGVEFTRFEPGTAALNGVLMETPFKVELKGSFVQIMSFLDEVAHLKRIVSGRSVTFKDPILRGSAANVNAEAVLVTYYFDENARPAPVTAPTSTSGAATSAAPTSGETQSAAPTSGQESSGGK